MIPHDALYTIRSYRNNVLMVETWHKSEASKDIEVSAYRTRMNRGEISHIEITALRRHVTETLFPMVQRKKKREGRR